MVEEINNYIEDDWNDNAVTNRTNASKGYYYNYHTGGSGDLLKGVYRPRWIAETGSISASNGKLQLGTDALAVTPSDITVGTFQVNFTLSNSGTLGTHGCDWLRIDGNNRYSSTYDGNQGYALDKVVNGSGTELLTASYSQTETQREDRMTRNSYGNIETFTDGSSNGTTTDTDITESNQIGLGGSYNASMDHDNLIVQ